MSSARAPRCRFFPTSCSRRTTANCASPPPISMSASAAAIEAQIEKPGATTLPARRLATIVRELPASEVQIEVDSKNVASIRCGQSFFKILGLPEEEFPPLPKFDDAQDLHAPAAGAARCAEENLLRDLDRRDALRAQRHPVFLQGKQAHHGRHGRTPARAGRSRSRISAQPGSRHHRADQVRDRTRSACSATRAM